MKIAIIGTSNTVIGMQGYVKALKLYHTVTCITAGRSPFYFHVQTILENRALLEEQDLIIVDHYVNDGNFYDSAAGPSYKSIKSEFYDLLSTLNTHVVNMLFPVRDLSISAAFQSSYAQAKHMSQARGISVLDLNQIGFMQSHFRDDIHVFPEISFMVGLFLARQLASASLGPKPNGGRLEICRFRHLPVEEIFSPDQISAFSNRLMTRNYGDLQRPLTIDAGQSERLIAISYVRMKERPETSGISVNGQNRAMGNFGYFVENVDIATAGPITIAPIASDVKTCPEFMRRGVGIAPFTHCYLSDLLFYDEQVEPIYAAASRTPIDLSMHGLLDAVQAMCPSKKRLSSATVDLLRDTAVKVEASNLLAASELMDLALQSRPDGSFLIAKSREFRNRLTLAAPIHPPKPLPAKQRPGRLGWLRRVLRNKLRIS